MLQCIMKQNNYHGKLLVKIKLYNFDLFRILCRDTNQLNNIKEIKSIFNFLNFIFRVKVRAGIHKFFYGNL